MMKPLEKIFWEELAEMVHVEEMLLKALPKMREAMESEPLKNEVETYRDNCEKQVETIRAVFISHSLPAREKKCDAMMGILQRGQQFMIRSGPGPALDAALLGVINKILGYKLGSYRSLMDWSAAMKADKVATKLQKALTFEEQAGKRFLALAPACNVAAAAQVQESVRKIPRKPRVEAAVTF